MKPITAQEYCTIMDHKDESGVCWGKKLQDEALSTLPMCFSVTCDPVEQGGKPLAASGFLTGNAARPAAYVCPNGEVKQCVYTGDGRAIPSPVVEVMNKSPHA